MEGKVVRYDQDMHQGDQLEMSHGHGTQVGGAIVGNSIHGGDDEANGSAPDAKIHVYDVQIGQGS